jgi:hypothetical protein
MFGRSGKVPLIKVAIAIVMANLFVLNLTCNTVLAQAFTSQKIKDNKPPVIKINKLPAETKATTIKISGTVNEKSTVKLNGIGLKLSSGNRFSYELKLAFGKNSVIIQAVDVSGNKTLEMLVVKRTKDFIVESVN